MVIRRRLNTNWEDFSYQRYFYRKIFWLDKNCSIFTDFSSTSSTTSRVSIKISLLSPRNSARRFITKLNSSQRRSQSQSTSRGISSWSKFSSAFTQALASSYETIGFARFWAFNWTAVASALTEIIARRTWMDWDLRCSRLLEGFLMKKLARKLTFLTFLRWKFKCFESFCRIYKILLKTSVLSLNLTP